jgi:hypothetical protein
MFYSGFAAQYGDVRFNIPYLKAGRLFSDTPIKENILSDFIAQYDPVKDINPAYFENAKYIKTKENKYPYGVDEHYLNAYLLPQLLGDAN